MEWYEAQGIRLACLAGSLSEARAVEILKDNIEDLRIVTSQRNDENGAPEDPKHPLFVRPQRVIKIDTHEIPKYIEFTDDATGETNVEKVMCLEFWAYGESYSAGEAIGNGTGEVRRTGDWIKSGPERFVKGDDGKIHQYGAATALLARLLEVAALQPVG